jgi:hypothetical protein
MLATSLTSLLLLVSHLSGSSAKYVEFGSGHHLLAHAALRRRLDSTSTGDASDAAPAAGANINATDVQTNYDWNGVINLSDQPPPDLVESASDLEDDKKWCAKAKVRHIKNPRAC